MPNMKPALLTCLAALFLTFPGNVFAGSLFQKAQTFSSGGKTADAIAVADMNGDGKPDLIVINECGTTNCDGTVAILLGNGDGTFQPATNYDTGLGATFGVIVADINGDSRPDVITLNSISCSPSVCTNWISVMYGNGDGTLGNWHHYSTGAYETTAMELVDINHDGKLDLIVGSNNLNGGIFSDSAVSVLLGNGNGSFQPAQVYDSGGQTLAQIAVADVNLDGNLDVVALNSDAKLAILLGNGNGTLQTAQNTQFSTVIFPNSLLAADLNHDGKPDLIIGTGFAPVTGHWQATLGVLLGNGDGTFQPIQLYGTGAPDPASISMAAADVNGDGKLDVIVALHCSGSCSNSPLVVMPGNGDGTFQAPQRYYSGGKNPDGIVLADLNGDGKLDIAVPNECVSQTDCTTGSVGILLGTSGVQTTTTLASTPNPSSYGQSVTFTSTVTSIGKNTPTGTVTFWNGSSKLGTATLVDGVGSLSKSTLSAGTFSITATYDGDTNSAKSTSAPISQVVTQASTTTTITSSLNPSNQGQLVTFTAVVTSPTARATGTVTFTSGDETLGTVTLGSEGKARLKISTLPSGSSQITATYDGTANLTGSSAALTQIVN